MLLFNTDRSEEFAPIKNGDEATSDNPRIAREIMSKLFKSWLKKANVEFSDNDPLEINFLDSYDGENLSHLQEIGKIDSTILRSIYSMFTLKSQTSIILLFKASHR